MNWEPCVYGLIFLSNIIPHLFLSFGIQKLVGVSGETFDLDVADKNEETYVMEINVTDINTCPQKNNTRIVYQILSVNEHTPIFTNKDVTNITLCEDIEIPFTNTVV